MSSKGSRIVVVGVFLLLSASVVRAQKITATLQGDVTDPSGAAVAGAKIVARNHADEQERVVPYDPAVDA